MSRKGMRHLRYNDRIKIEALVHMKIVKSKIAEEIGCSVRTIERELVRGRYSRLRSDYTQEDSYSAEIAQTDHDYKATNRGSDLKIGHDRKFADYIEDKIINQKYSPAAALRAIKIEGKHFETQVCFKTIYNYIKSGVFLKLTSKHLPRGGKKTRTYHQVQRIKKPLCRSIEERPKEADERTEIGHWEMDTVLGPAKGGGPALLVLTERKTRRELIFKLGQKTQREVKKVLDYLERRLGKKFTEVFKTITVDNGSEFLDGEGLERSVYTKRKKRTMVYFCHPYSSWERGSNEVQNVMIRRFIPKGESLRQYSEEEIRWMQDWMNEYPRKILEWLNAKLAGDGSCLSFLDTIMH